MRLPIKTDLNTKDLLWVYDCMWTILCVCVWRGDAPWRFLFKKPLFTEMQFDNQQLSRMTHSPNCCVGAGPCCPIFPEPLYPWSQIKWQWVALRRSLRAEQGGDNGITLMIPNCITQRARGERTDTSASLLTRRFRPPGGRTVSFPAFYSIDTRMNMQLFNRVRTQIHKGT